MDGLVGPNSTESDTTESRSLSNLFLAAVHHFVNLQKGFDQPLLFLVVRCTVILIIVLGVSLELVALHLLMPCSAWCRVNLAVHPLCQIRMRLRLKNL